VISLIGVDDLVNVILPVLPGISTAVAAMPSWELFEQQDAGYRMDTLGQGCVRVGVEAAMRFGWDRYLGEHGAFVGMTGFGASGPADALYEHFGITPDAIAAAATAGLRSKCWMR